MLLEELLILKHVSHSGGDGGLLPGVEGLRGVLDCSVELIPGGLGDPTDEGLGSL